MGTASLVPGKKVKVNPGTRVHVWDFERGQSDTWLIDGGSAEHEFLVKSGLEDPTLPHDGSHVVLVQAGFEHEYEIRVDPSKITEVVMPPGLPSTSPSRRATTRGLRDQVGSVASDAPGLPEDLFPTIRSAWSTVRSGTRDSIRQRLAR